MMICSSIHCLANDVILEGDVSDMNMCDTQSSTQRLLFKNFVSFSPVRKIMKVLAVSQKGSSCQAWNAHISWSAVFGVPALL